MGQPSSTQSIKSPDNRKLLRSILALSIPSIVTNVTTPLLGIADVTIAGHMGSAVFIAAIAVGGSMFNMLYWLFGFLRMGSSGMTAQCFGAGNHKEASAVLYRALTIAMAIGLAMILLRHPIGNAILDIMDTDADTRGYAESYYDICIWGAPAVLGTFALTGWFLGMQNSRAPMWVSIFMDVFNVALSLTLVYAFHLGMEGIATGTLCAQWAGFILGAAICLTRYGLQRIALRELFRWQSMKRFFSINVDIFLRTICLVCVTMWFTRVGAMRGAVMLAVNALLMQLFTLFSFFMDGFAFSGEALCGRFIGEGNAASLRATIKMLLKCGAAIALLFTAIYVTSGTEFIRLLSDDDAVVTKSAEYFWWAVAIPIAGFTAFTWDGVFIGTTDTRSMLISMAMATTVFFAIYSALFDIMGNHGLWLAFIGYLFTRGAALSVIGRKYFRADYLSDSPYSAK